MPRVTPYADSPREPLEILCRLAGRSSYVTPTAGSGGMRGIGTVEDIAHALATVSDPLGKQMAMAMACQTLTEWARIQALAHPQVMAELLGSWKTRALVEGPLKYRVRLVLFDAARVLVWPQMHCPDRAQMLRMQRQAYRMLHRHVSACLENAARNAASEACARLFG